MSNQKKTPKGLAILGSTGSIGTQTLDIVRAFPDRLRVVGLAANRSLGLLRKQVEEFRPRLVSCQGTAEEKLFLSSNGCADSRMEEVACHPEVDLVVSATTSDVALGPTFAAMAAGKNIALANKETIVMAGELVTGYAEKLGVSLLPMDSEPNAIWQCIQGEGKEVSRLIITASGGAFRKTDLKALADVTPEQALKHPTWKMGPKITIDSATLMNKALEVIEAHWLFRVPWDRIEVVIHPQSVIHSMVEFADGSVKAQISPPDMRLPIQYALFYPERVYNESIRRFDPIATGALTFEPWEPDRFPCFQLALDLAQRGGTWPAALCGADEMAVQMFLSRRIGFLEIEPTIREALEGHRSIAEPTLDEIIQAAQWGRERVSSIVEA
ncbi:MAG: 1-deoxy-D-xylulose-5-phosphate reductoisomerase [Chloroflexi bacterium]|nr:1-deoxy-D-xylulose-5-phosphate reductoisomerase [Chloroflexota bacterium]